MTETYRDPSDLDIDNEVTDEDRKYLEENRRRCREDDYLRENMDRLFEHANEDADWIMADEEYVEGEVTNEDAASLDDEEVKSEEDVNVDAHTLATGNEDVGRDEANQDSDSVSADDVEVEREVTHENDDSLSADGEVVERGDANVDADRIAVDDEEVGREEECAERFAADDKVVERGDSNEGANNFAADDKEVGREDAHDDDSNLSADDEVIYRGLVGEQDANEDVYSFATDDAEVETDEDAYVDVFDEEFGRGVSGDGDGIEHTFDSNESIRRGMRGELVDEDISMFANGTESSVIRWNRVFADLKCARSWGACPCCLRSNINILGSDYQPDAVRSIWDLREDQNSNTPDNRRVNTPSSWLESRLVYDFGPGKVSNTDWRHFPTKIRTKRYKREVKPRTPADLGILPNRPRHPEYSNVSARLRTFMHGQWNVLGGTTGVAEAGFHYIGSGDRVQCFYCGGCVQGWKENDNPINEHQKLFPDCDYIKLISEKEDSHHPCQSQSPATFESHTRINPLILLAVEENGYTREQAQEAFERLQQNERRRDYSVAEIISIIEGQNEQIADFREELSGAALDNLVHENEELKAKRECAVCRDKLSDIMFLPCTHLNVCAICAPNVDSCPLCRTGIQGRVKVQFATFSDTQAYEGG